MGRTRHWTPLRLWFRRVRLSHFRYGHWSPMSREEDQEVLNHLSCSELVLQPHSSSSCSWCSFELRSWWGIAELAENYFQKQAILHFLLKVLLSCEKSIVQLHAFYPLQKMNSTTIWNLSSKQFHTMIPCPQNHPWA